MQRIEDDLIDLGAATVETKGSVPVNDPDSIGAHLPETVKLADD